MEEIAPCDGNVMTGAHKSRIAEDQGGGQIAVQQKLLRTIEVSQNGIEQTCTLNEPGFEIITLFRGNEQWNGIQAPGAIHPERIAVHVVTNAVVPDAAAGNLPAMSQFLVTQ